jgi:tyrosine decarboxylase / aspartate 1-decarboxylase
MVLEKTSLTLLTEALEKLESSFHGLPEFEPTIDLNDCRTVLLEVAHRMQDNFPYPHPLYVGQMLKPPHPIARLAYMLSLWVNPNNHALDGGRASSAMEKEAIAEIAQMFGWSNYLGHLTGGGTMANLEALWVSEQITTSNTVVASQQAHYTHQRISAVLNLPFQSVPCDRQARMDIEALKRILDTEAVGTVVVTAGATATGAVDPLPKILQLQAQYQFRIHVDAAYGGYFTLADNLAPETRAVFDALSSADSIAIDPHKHGLQPYGCGCILFKDPSVGKFYQHDSPYTYFSSAELHLGEISLECSRPGAAAVALWATQRLLPLVPQGAFANDMSRVHQAALALFHQLKADDRFLVAFPPELDVVVWIPLAETASAASQRSREIFSRCAQANLHFAIANLPKSIFAPYWPDLAWDQDTITCLRSCLMKPEHLDWLDRIWRILDDVTNEVLAK